MSKIKILGRCRQFLDITSPKISEMLNFPKQNDCPIFQNYFFGNFWRNLRKILGTDFAQSHKNCQKCFFFAQMSVFRENGQRSQKSVRATFLTFFTPNFVPSFGKSLGAVSEIIRNRQTDGQTDKWTHKPDFIGSSRLSTGNQ